MAKVKSRRTPEQDIAAQTEAVKTLRYVLANDADDAELFRDMIEGETSFFEIFDAVYDNMRQDLEMIDGISAREKDLKDRKARINDRVNMRRAKLEMALSVYGETIERPEATFAMTRRAPSVVIEDERDIPAAYFKSGEPVLDKAKLLAALKEQAAALAELKEGEKPPEPIPGATLSNSPVTLTIRTK